MNEDQVFQKDKHASVRVLFSENRRLGTYRRGPKDGDFAPRRRTDEDVPLIVSFIATYVMEMGIFCVDASVVTLQHSVTPHEVDTKTFTKRILETHEFPAAVRRAVVLADEVRNEFVHNLRVKLGDKFVEPSANADVED